MSATPRTTLAPGAGKRILICIVTGFTSGLPLFILLNLLPAWLKSSGVAIATIGLFALIQIPYTWKFLWAPFLDRFALPLGARRGRRRGWIFFSAAAALLVTGWLGNQEPQADLRTVVGLCLLLALLSATLDIALDAYRRELLPDAELGLGNAVHVNAYKVASLIPGALALVLADGYLPWSAVFWVTALFLLPGILLALFLGEAKTSSPAPVSLREAVIAPFSEFWHRRGARAAITTLLFIFCYKLGDSLCTSLATPFYLDMGYHLTDIGLVAKNAGLWPSVIGGLIGGVWMLRLGINRALWLFGLAQAIAILGFAWLAALGPQTAVDAAALWRLGGVIGLEAFGVGLGTTAFVAFVARESNPAYSATQIALFTSLMAMPRTFINAVAGYLVAFFGWPYFFCLCFALALPGFWLLLQVAPWRVAPPDTPGMAGSA